MSVSVTLKKRGLEILVGNLRALGRHVLTIGFQGPDGVQQYEGGINVATVALYNEFGTKSIPARSFLRSTMFQQRNKIEKIMARAAKRVLENVDTFSPNPAVIESLSTAGAEIVALVDTKLVRSRGWAKRNAPSTVAKKGFDYPLHDTGKLEGLVSWAVRSGSAQGPILAQGKS